eukprot:gnl/TRDRNA2_/TRDRNA2_84580_c0_seq1.p1 gnl/TRDRNA2_/TRDRNA2_84580_c0~~gnl/TRDRNA2_/TRDRNA2_84580_c0_seq1.p1  ORF type:complete len:178 (-),score=9.97 gnl/TRDRNA2_/TRDRNA2_84580_c0_seq1:378-911(-)
MSIFRIAILVGGITVHAARLRLGSMSSSSSLRELVGRRDREERGSYNCPPPQDCNCGCWCPEIVWPGAPPPGPMYPTPIPHFSLLQNGHGSAALNDNGRKTGRTLLSGSSSEEHVLVARAGQQLPGFAGPQPGAPISMLPPPPAPPLPPPPQDFRDQPCPENPPCNCYCHCGRPPGV